MTPEEWLARRSQGPTFQQAEYDPNDPAEWLRRHREESQGPTFQQANYNPEFEQQTQALVHPPDSRPIVNAAEPWQDLMAQAQQAQIPADQQQAQHAFNAAPQGMDFASTYARANMLDAGANTAGLRALWDTAGTAFSPVSHFLADAAGKTYKQIAGHQAPTGYDFAGGQAEPIFARQPDPMDRYNPDLRGTQFAPQAVPFPEGESVAPPRKVPTRGELAQQAAAQQETGQSRNYGLPLWKLPGIGQFFDPNLELTSEALMKEGMPALPAMALEMGLPVTPFGFLKAGQGLAGMLGHGAEALEGTRAAGLGKALNAELKLPGQAAREAAQAAAEEAKVQQYVNYKLAQEQKAADYAQREHAWADLTANAPEQGPLTRFIEDNSKLKSAEQLRQERLNPQPLRASFEDDPGIAYARQTQDIGQRELLAQQAPARLARLEGKPPAPAYRPDLWTPEESAPPPVETPNKVASLLDRQKQLKSEIGDFVRDRTNNRTPIEAVQEFEQNQKIIDSQGYRPNDLEVPPDVLIRQAGRLERRQWELEQELNAFAKDRNAGPAPIEQYREYKSNEAQLADIDAKLARGRGRIELPGENATPGKLAVPEPRGNVRSAEEIAMAREQMAAERPAFREPAPAEPMPERSPQEIAPERPPTPLRTAFQIQEDAARARNQAEASSAFRDLQGESPARPLDSFIEDQGRLRSGYELRQQRGEPQRWNFEDDPAVRDASAMQGGTREALAAEQAPKRLERLAQVNERLKPKEGQIITDSRYMGSAPVRGTGTGAQPTAPATNPAPATSGSPKGPPPMAVPAAKGATPYKPAPLQKLKNDMEIVRDLDKTLSRVQNNDFGNTLLDKARRALSTKTGNRIVYGKAKGQGQMVGTYEPKVDLITAAHAGDYGAVFHEAGHKLDTYTKFVDTAPPEVLRELEHLGDPGNARPVTTGTSSWQAQQSAKVKAQEGFGEFLRVWMTDPEHIRNNYPKLLEHWNQKLEDWNDIGRRLVNHQTDFQLFKKGDIFSRTEAKMVRDIPSNPATPTDFLEAAFDKHIRLRILTDMVEQKIGKKLMPTDDPYHLARMFAHFNNKVTHWLETGPLDWETQAPVPGKRGLFPILMDAGPTMDHLKEFETYLTHKRSEELLGRGIKSGFDADGMQKIKAALPADRIAHLENLSNEIYDYNNNLLDYMVKAGVYTPDAVAAMKRLNTAYVPFYRLFEHEAGQFEQQLMASGSGLNAANPAMRIKGSDREIYPPVQNLIRNTAQMLQSAHKNQIGQSLLKLWDEQAPLVGHMFHEPEQGMVKAATVSLDEIISARKLRSELESIGVDFDNMQVTDKELRDLMQLIPERDIYRQDSKLKDNWIRVRDKGEDRFLQLKPDFYRAWSALDEGQISQFVKGIKIFGVQIGPTQIANTLRKGATTFSPGFLFFRNPAKDTMEAAVMSHNGFKPLLSTLQGVKTYLTDEKTWSEFYRHSGAQTFEEMVTGNPAGPSNRAKELYNRMSPGQKEMTLMNDLGRKAVSPFAFVLDKYHRLGNIGEQATRLGEYEKAKAAIAKANPSWPMHQVERAASFEALDLMDFSLRGSSEALRNARRIIPFFGAGMNGLYKFGKEVQRNPAKVFSLGLSYITAPSMGLMAINAHNPYYWQKDQVERDHFWLIPTFSSDPEKMFVRIAKPHLPGLIFSTIPERFAQWAFFNDKHAFDGLMAESIDKTAPVGWDIFGGPLGKTVIENTANYDFFRRKPIESTYDQREHAASWLRSNEYSSATAKALAKVLPGGMSPLKIDHTISNLTGYGGSSLVESLIDPAVSRLTGETLRKEKPRSFFGLFANTPIESERRFQERLKELQQQSDAAHSAHPSEPKRGYHSNLPDLNAMEAADKRLRVLRKMKNSKKNTPEELAQIEGEIWDITSKFTPTTGGYKPRPGYKPR